MNSAAEPKRAYRQTARAEAAEANARRVVEAFRARLETHWFDEIRLDDIAAEAGVTVQTIIRRFGGKDGLLDAATEAMEAQILEIRETTPGDITRIIDAVLADYEVTGDLIMRLLSQEQQHAAIGRTTDLGRAHHRSWVAASFEPWLAGLTDEARRRRLDALVVATDLYVWKLIRRDMARPLDELRTLMRRLVDAALA